MTLFRRVVTLLALVPVLVLVPPPPTATVPAHAGEGDEIADYLAAHRARTGVPGLAWAVVDREGIARSGAIGVDGTGRPVGEHTPFVLGSISKTFTAALVLRRAEAGVLDLDAPVAGRLRWFRTASPARGERITAAQLLRHRSGFDAAAGLRVADRPSTGPDAVERTARDLRGTALTGRPGRTYRYSSANYLMLGALVEQQAGEPFADTLADELLGPLGMSDAAGYAADPGAVPPGHRLAWGSALRYDPGPVAGGLPYGYVAASAADASAMAGSLLTAAPGRVWPRAMLRAVHTDPAPDAADAEYDSGWRVEVRDGERIAWHSGATPGYFASVLLLPHRGLGVVLLQNGYAPARDAQLNEAAFDVARLATGRAIRPVGADGLLLALPWLLVAVGLTLLGVTVAATVGRRDGTARGPGSWPGAIWSGVLVAVAIGTAWLLPGLAGADVRVLARWTPDVFGAGAVLVGCCATAVVVTGVVARTRHRGPRRGAGPARATDP